MSWQILIAISLFGNSAQTLLQRFLLKKEDSDPASFVIVTSLLAAVFLTLFGLINKPSYQDLTPFIPNIIFSSVAYGIGTLFWFSSLKYIEASEFIVLWTSRAFWAILGGILFLGERFSLLQVFGTILIFFSIFLASWRSRKFRLGKGELFALAGAPFYGFAFVSDGYILRTIDPLIYVPLGFFITAAFVLILKIKSIHLIWGLINKVFSKLILLSFFSAITAFSYLSAISVSGNVGQISVINQTSTIIIVIAGIFLLNERSQIFKKIIAAIISFIGILLIK